MTSIQTIIADLVFVERLDFCFFLFSTWPKSFFPFSACIPVYEKRTRENITLSAQ